MCQRRVGVRGRVEETATIQVDRPGVARDEVRAVGAFDADGQTVVGLLRHGNAGRDAIRVRRKAGINRKRWANDAQCEIVARGSERRRVAGSHVSVDRQRQALQSVLLVQVEVVVARR